MFNNRMEQDDSCMWSFLGTKWSWIKESSSGWVCYVI